MDIDTLSTQTLQKNARKQASWAMGAFKQFSEDRCTAMAASIAFYAAFSLAPTLVMVIAVAGWFFGAEAARGELFSHIHGLLGDEAATGVQTIVENAHHSGTSGGIAAIVSFVLLAVGASATFSSLNSALNVVWPVTGPRTSSLITLVRVRLTSFGLVLGVAFLLIVSLVLDTAITFIGKLIWGDSPYVLIGNLVQLAVGLLVLAGAFTGLLKFLPDARVRWRDAFVGGIVAAVLFTAGKKLFALYLAHAGTANSFGAAGSLAVLLMWLYFSALVLLLGAEFSAARGRQHDPRGEWGVQDNVPPGSRAKLASVLAASTRTTPAAREAALQAGAVVAANQAMKASASATADAHESALAERDAQAARLAAAKAVESDARRAALARAGVAPPPSKPVIPLERDQRDRSGAASGATSKLARARQLGGKVVRAESEATRMAAVALVQAGHRAAEANHYVKKHPWRSVLMAAGTAAFVAALTGGRRQNASPSSTADDASQDAGPSTASAANPASRKHA